MQRDIGAEGIDASVPEERAEEACAQFQDLQCRSARVGRVVGEVWSDDSGNGVNGSLLDPSLRDSGRRGDSISTWLMHGISKTSQAARAMWKIASGSSSWQGSFRPSEGICALRELIRQRDMLISYRSSHIQHMQKALEQMNLKLTQVVSDITGVTGLMIIRSILEGEQDPPKLASYRHRSCPTK